MIPDYERRHNILRDRLRKNSELIKLNPELIIASSIEYELYNQRLIGSVDIMFELFDYRIYVEVKGTGSERNLMKGENQCKRYLDWHYTKGVALSSQPAESWLVYPNRHLNLKNIKKSNLEVIIYEHN